MEESLVRVSEILRRAASGIPASIAEIGTSHGGQLDRGRQLIEAAARAGADIVKFQVIFAREILPPEAGMVPLPQGPTPLYQVFEELEQPPEFYEKLTRHASLCGVGFLASPFGNDSVKRLEELGVQAWKVASPELNHEPLLIRLARTGKPMILSTGVSLPSDIDRALEVIRRAASEPDSSAHVVDLPETTVPGTPKPSRDDVMRASASGQSTSRLAHATGAPPKSGARLASAPASLRNPFPPDAAVPPVFLLHCLTSYPAPEDEANMKSISTMRHIWQQPTGFSDHSLNPAFLPAVAVTLGAVLVEKHITLSKTSAGLDDSVALTPEQFAAMTQAMKKYAKLRESEPAARHELEREFGADALHTALGDGLLRLSPSEKAHYGRTNRSLHAVGPLSAGTVLTRQNTALLRTEKVLRPGLAPRDRHQAYGKTLKRDVPSGEGIVQEDFE